MRAKLLLSLAFGAALLGQGCRSANSRPLPPEFAVWISQASSNGWKVVTSNNTITLRRDSPVWIMGYISRPPQVGTKEEYFKKDGSEIHYELRLRFVPLLSQLEYESLRTARTQAAARLKQGASGKDEYGELQKRYEQCQVPLFHTQHYSVFVDRWAENRRRIEPLFVEVYPSEAASEIDNVVKSLGQVFQAYDNSGT
jgi:hypothetical protein